MSSLLAYIDPGTGSQIGAIIAAGFAGLAVTMKIYWNRLLIFLRIRKPEEEGTTEPDAT